MSDVFIFERTTYYKIEIASSVHTFRIFYNTKRIVTYLVYGKGRGING